MIRELGSWVLNQSCTDVAALQQQLGQQLRFSVNVSPHQLRGTAWLDEVLAALARTGLEPTQLELEITEGVLIDAHGDAVELLARIRREGVQIAVDDFGRGYSSLAYLTSFPVDKLKIDRSFIQEIASDNADAAIVDAIIVMCHALGLQVVAEGVETIEQERYLRARGCDEAQGFLYGPGVAVEDVPAAVRRLHVSDGTTVS